MSDKNFFSVVREDNPNLSGFVSPPNYLDYDDVLKFSMCANVLVADKTIDGGVENCIDAVRGSKYRINKCTLRCHGTAAIVLKGGIDGWKVTDNVISPAGPTDIEVGQFDNYWYPFKKNKTRHGTVSGNRCLNGAALRVQCWDAEKPDRDAYVTVTKIYWPIWFPYFCFRFIWIRLFDGVPWVWKYDPPQTPTKNGIPQ